MFEPARPLKFSFAAPYFDQIRAGIKRLVKEKGLKKVCTVYQDDDFGLEVMRGAEAGFKDLGATYAERTTYKRGATDFASQVAKMKEAGCDGVVMGTIIRETIGVIGTARKLDWNPVFVGTTASYSEIIHKLGGAVVNGFYSTCTVNNPYADDPNPKVKEWFAAYKGKFNEDPTVFSAYGWQIINLFATAANAAGKDLTPELAQQGDRNHQVPLRHVRRRRADLLGHQAARLRSRHAVPDPGRPLEVGVRVHDALRRSSTQLSPHPEETHRSSSRQVSSSEGGEGCARELDGLWSRRLRRSRQTSSEEVQTFVIGEAGTPDEGHEPRLAATPF